MVMLNAAGLAYILISRSSDHFEKLHTGLLHFLLANFVWFNVTQLTKLYRDLFVKDAIPTIKAALSSLALFGLIIGIFKTIVADFQWYSPAVAIPFLLFGVLLLLGKIGFLLWRRSSGTRWIAHKPVVILGAGLLGTELKAYIDANSLLGYRVIGFFDDRLLRGQQEVNILGSLENSIAYAKENNIREIFCALPDSALGKIKILMRQAEQEMIRFKMVPDVKDYFRKNVNVQWFGYLPVLSPRTEPLEIKINQVLKRAFDITISLFVIIFLFIWIFPVIACLIKLSSKGPVFFRQLRSGKNNEPFYCIKFRSMLLNDEADSRQATKNDHRITKIGTFMRRNSIDELPQFFNVLIGEMSVVGPRPHMLKHTAAYAELIDQFMVRHFVLPGVTGWAQIRGLRGETFEHKAMQERVEADIWYLENWSMFLDLKILFLTAWHLVVGSKNAH
ncbi:putative colanic acid biosysnthesis UDP-glucose lipid carrier transferase [Pedobacter hartonius]|uniref:Putative colanic acid biosysnthesis UDP-glucose lipid carrier transferase n=2 Tax=Pedobacter hartonius TaxID=425514 RepID=A0A1H4FN17_9SPHI|nr:putative colanic acid biosysnthesis UDP-glucose lipid carrier transferase [Pedobacter hartonius]